MVTKTFTSIGEVTFVKSRRARRLTLSVRPWRGVRVTLPRSATYREAESFLLTHAAWVGDRLAQVRQHSRVNGFALPEAEKRAGEELLRRRALTFLPERTAALAEKHRFSYRRLTLRRSRTRWGSCSAANNINLSIFLMNLPPHLIDYVILHELAHTVHKNHSSSFWSLLDGHTGGRARELAKETGRYRITL